MIIKRKLYSSTPEEDEAAYNELQEISKKAPKGVKVDYKKDLVIKAIRHEMRLNGEDPDNIKRPDIIYKSKSFSLGGRLKAAAKTYKSSKEYYDSDGYKKEMEGVINNIENDPKIGEWCKTEKGKEIAKKDAAKEGIKLRKQLLKSSRRKAASDAYYKFKDKYWME